MAGEDLVFNILARDKGAKKTFKDLGDEAERTAGKFTKLGAVSAGLGALGPLGATATGGLLALPAIAGAGAAALGTLAMAFQGIKGAIGSGQNADRLEFDGMARSAAEFSSEASHVTEALSDMQHQVQSEFFKPLVGTFDRLANAYLPMLGRQVPALATDLGRAARAFTSVLTEAGNVERVSAVLESSRTSMTNLGRAGGSLTTVFLRLADAGGGFSERFTGDLSKAAAAFDRFIARAQGNGSLTRLFDTAASSVESLGRALAPLASSLYNLFSSSGTAGAAANLFSVLGGGTRIVATLVNAFAALPSALQSSVLNLGAVSLLASRIIPMVGSLGVGLGSLAVRAQNLGTAAASTATGLATTSAALTRFAGPIGLAVAALGFLVTAMGSTSDKTKPLERDLNKLTDTIRTYAESGRVIGEFAKTTGGSMEMLAARARDAADQLHQTGKYAPPTDQMEQYNEFVKQSSKSMGQLLEESSKVQASAQRASNQSRENITKIAAATAELARSGDIRSAAIAYQQFSEAFQQQGYSAEWVKEKMADYLEVTGGLTISQYDAAKATSGVEQVQRLLNGTWQDAINKIGSLSQAFDAFNEMANGALNATIAAEGAQDDLVETLTRNGHAWDLNTKAGRENQQALQKAISTAAEAAEQQKNTSLATKSESEALADSVAVWNTYIQRAREGAIGTGLAAGAVDAFIAAFARMPTGGTVPVTVPGVSESTQKVLTLSDQIRDLKDKQVKVEESGAENAAQRVAALQRQIDALQNRDVQIKTQIFEQRTYSSVGEFAETHGRAMGGIDLKMAEGGITSRWLRSPTILAGERGSEAYISMSAPKGRSRQIAREAVNMLGGPEAIWPTAGRGAGGGSTYVVNVTVTGGSSTAQTGAQVGAATVKAIKEYEQVNGAGWRRA